MLDMKCGQRFFRPRSITVVLDPCSPYNNDHKKSRSNKIVNLKATKVCAPWLMTYLGGSGREENPKASFSATVVVQCTSLLHVCVFKTTDESKDQAESASQTFT